MKKSLFLLFILSFFSLFLYGQQYKVGDLIVNDDGSEGVVFWVYPDGSGGWMCALDWLGGKYPWGPAEDIPGLPPVQNWLLAKEDTAGYTNTKLIRDHLGTGNTYAAQVVDFDNGWYLPAAGQQRKLMGVLPSIENTLQKKINDFLNIRFCSSTIRTLAEVYIDYYYEYFFTLSGFKSDVNLSVWPVRNFTMSNVLVDTTLNYVWNTGAVTPSIKDTPAQTTDYTVTVTTGAGCEASASQRIFVGDTPEIIYDTICEGDTYTQHGFLATSTGTYSHTIPGEGSCDLDLTLHLVVNRPDTTRIDTSIFEGRIYTGHNFTAWESGDYLQRWQRDNLCDSVVLLRLTVIPNRSTQLYDTVCYGSSYRQHGFDLSDLRYSDIHSLLYHTSDGNDSLVHLHLTVNPVLRTNFFADACLGSSYSDPVNNFHIPVVRRDTSIIHTYTGSLGCDSIVSLYLSAHDLFRHHIRDTVCLGDSYSGYGFTVPVVTGDTLLCDTLPTLSGCDSLVSLHLSAVPRLETPLHDVICYGGHYRSHGFDIPNVTVPVTKSILLPGSGGCDSLVTLHLGVLPLIVTDLFDTVCHGQTYSRYGFTIPDVTVPVTDTRFLTGHGGCDSLVSLHLSVAFPGDTLFLSDAVCSGNRYQGHGFHLPSVTRDTICHATLTDRYGCDSTVTLHLSVLTHSAGVLYDTCCAGTSYSGYGFTVPDVQSGGTYTRTLVNFLGCDSIVTLHLHVHLRYEQDHYGDICQGGTYSGYGFTVPAVMRDTTCTDSLASRFGCDSVVRLHLTVHPVYDTLLYDVICLGDTYTGHGFTVPSVLYDTTLYAALQSKRGCDSLVTLQLTVLPHSDTLLYGILCSGDDYLQNGFSLHNLQRDTTVVRRLGSSNGCDSTVTLYLTVHPAYRFSESGDICGGGHYLFQGDTLYRSGTYQKSYTTAHGCDSTYTLRLTVHPRYDDTLRAVICEGDTYTGSGFTEREAGTYTHRETSRFGCDSLFTLVLRVDPALHGHTGITLLDCERHDYSFLFRPSGDTLPAAECHWDFGDGYTAEGFDARHSYTDSGTYAVTVRLTTAAGCSWESDTLCRVPYYTDDIRLLVNRDAIDEDNPALYFEALPFLPGLDYRWDMGDGSIYTLGSFLHRYPISEEDAYYVTLTVTNADSCSVTERRRIAVYKPFDVPNTFSPNGDGINDHFMAGYRVRIVSRAGHLVYEGDDGWDGSYKGGRAKEDVYFYELTYPTLGGDRTRTGYITVIH